MIIHDSYPMQNYGQGIKCPRRGMGYEGCTGQIGLLKNTQQLSKLQCLPVTMPHILRFSVPNHAPEDKIHLVSYSNSNSIWTPPLAPSKKA